MSRFAQWRLLPDGSLSQDEVREMLDELEPLAEVGLAVERLMDNDDGDIAWGHGRVSLWAGHLDGGGIVEGTAPTLIAAINAALEDTP